MTGISDAIRNLLASYHFYGDNHMTEELAGLFARHGILETVDSGTSRGREAVAGFLRSRHERRMPSMRACAAPGTTWRPCTLRRQQRPRRRSTRIFRC
jgi:SnoaL-like domain